MTNPIKAKIQELCPDLEDGYWTGSHNGFKDNPHWVAEPCITLAVVLRAINGRRLEFGGHVHAVHVDGTFLTTQGETGIRWNTKFDNYDQQSEECKQFIGSLIGV